MPNNFVNPNAAVSINFNWITTGGSLFSAVKGGSFVTANLETTANTKPKFSIISGSLPKGLTLTNTDQFSGYISGFAISDSKAVTYTFVVRAVSIYYRLPIDRTFSITVLPYDPPVWSYLGDLTYLQGPNVDGSFDDLGYVSQQLIAVAPAGASSSYNITYSLSTNSGRLPTGLKLSSTGTLNGVINLPLNVQTAASNTYTFTVVASSSGVSTSRSFVMLIRYYNSFRQPPVFLINPNLGSYRTNSIATIPVTAYDPYPSYGSVVYALTDGILPNGLNVDTTSGVVTGIIPLDNFYLRQYQFRISATKFNIFEGFSTASTQIFNMTVLQNNYNSITWTTPSNLGTLPASIPCRLRLVATHTETAYNLMYYSNSQFPDGLKLDSNGDIVGIPTSVGTYNIVAVATTATIYNSQDWSYYASIGNYPSLCAISTFVVNVVANPLQYTNIYARVFLPVSSRLQIRQILNNTDIFKTKYIYRSTDPNFGIVSDLKMYVQYGIQQLSSSIDYQSTFLANPLSNYEKVFYVGTATAVTIYDSSKIALYDVVYLKVSDSNQGTDILNKIQLKFLSLLDGQIDTNSLFLPPWQQTENSSFIYGIVLCYAIPGKGSVIINNLKKYSQILGNFDFSTINFTIDRFIIEKTLSSNAESYLMLP